MNRLLLGLGLLVALLVTADNRLRTIAESARVSTSVLRPLTDPRAEVVPERVRVVSIRPRKSSQAWTYELKGKAWRYPGYFGAHVLSDRIVVLLRSLLQSAGTVVSTDSGNYSHYGLTSDTALRIELRDGSGAQLLDVWLGRGAPGPRSPEAYVRRAGEDTVIHLHTNPLHALVGATGVAPLIDPHVLPRNLARKQFVRVNFITDEPGVAPSLWRIEVPPDTAARALPRPGQVDYRWLAGSAGAQVDTCPAANVFAYTSFLRKLRYQRLHDPDGDYGFAAAGRSVELIDEEGMVDVLEVGDLDDERGGVLLRNRTANMVCSVAPEKATLLFPQLRPALLDSLPRPSPYDLAEPTGGRLP